jgi:hypothetical protein
MKTTQKIIAAVALFCAVNVALALDATQQNRLDMLTSGSMRSVKTVSQDIFNSGESSQVVLDALAEVLLKNAPNAPAGNIDALSWAAKALGHTRNPRYRDALNSVANNSSAHKKLRKYAENAAEELSGSSVPQYKQGMASLKPSSRASHTSHNSSASSTRSSAGAGQPLSAVHKGMSMQEAYALVGEPTTSTGHITGKAWIPFNFRGADTARQYSLYKGKGRIIFTNSSYYDHTWRVYEVQLDSNESGYP